MTTTTNELDHPLLNEETSVKDKPKKRFSLKGKVDWQLFSPTYQIYKNYVAPRGLTQRFLAVALQIPLPTFNNMIRGTGNLDCFKAYRMAKFLNIDLSIILDYMKINAIAKEVIRLYPELSSNQLDLYYFLVTEFEKPEAERCQNVSLFVNELLYDYFDIRRGYIENVACARKKKARNVFRFN